MPRMNLSMLDYKFSEELLAPIHDMAVRRGFHVRDVGLVGNQEDLPSMQVRALLMLRQNAATGMLIEYAVGFYAPWTAEAGRQFRAYIAFDEEEAIQTYSVACIYGTLPVPFRRLPMSESHPKRRYKMNRTGTRELQWAERYAEKAGYRRIEARNIFRGNRVQHVILKLYDTRYHGVWGESAAGWAVGIYIPFRKCLDLVMPTEGEEGAMDVFRLWCQDNRSPDGVERILSRIPLGALARVGSGQRIGGQSYRNRDLRQIEL